MQAAATKKQQAIADHYAAQITAVKQQAQKLHSVNQSISKVISSVHRALSSIDNIDTALLHMSSAIANTPTDPKATPTTFDSNLSAISSMAQGDTSSKNLLGTMYRGGSYLPNSLTYTANSGGQTVTVQGEYLGSDYTITQPDGTFWMPSGTQSMQRYAAYPFGKQGGAISTNPENFQGTASTADSTATFTTGLSLAASGQNTYSGSVAKYGLQMGSAWMYNNFATADDRTQADKDIDAARSKLAITKTNLSIALAKASSDLAKEKTAQAQSDAKIASLQSQAKAAMQKVVDQTKRQFNTMQTALANAGVDVNGTSGFGTGQSAGMFMALLPGTASTQPVDDAANALTILSGSVNILT
ncbi:MAG TPA: hypothetical protein VK558_05930 [Patescibacteria group bacterium]|nr:hypothetical protein [Patescibacteria group bacterium]